MTNRRAEPVLGPKKPSKLEMTPFLIARYSPATPDAFRMRLVACLFNYSSALLSTAGARTTCGAYCYVTKP